MEARYRIWLFLIFCAFLQVAAAPNGHRDRDSKAELLVRLEKEIQRGIQKRIESGVEEVEADEEYFDDSEVYDVGKRPAPKVNKAPPPAAHPTTKAGETYNVTVEDDFGNGNETINGTAVIGAVLDTWNALIFWIEHTLHVPLWVAYVIGGAIVALALLILLCCLCCCCCGKKDKKKASQKSRKRPTEADMGFGVEDINFFAKYGRLEYTLEYDSKKFFLTVGIVQVTDIPGLDLDPYVRLSITPKPEEDKGKKRETSPKKKCTNPVFNETFKIKILDFNTLANHTLVFEMFDYNLFGRDTMIGRYALPLGEVEIQEYYNQSYENVAVFEAGQIADLGAGDICFSFRYAPLTSKLIVNILECKNLRVGLDTVNKPNPYVVAKFHSMTGSGRTKIFRKKTCQRIGTSNPYFNEDLIFSAPDLGRLASSKLVITVKHKSTVVKLKRTLGFVTLSNSGDTAEKSHWQNAISNPRHSIARWHILKDPREKSN